MSNNKCLGFIETFGLAACVAAADAAVKCLVMNMQKAAECVL